MKRKFWLAGVCVAAIALWVVFSDSRMSWREEVQLQSGEVIVIKRTAKFSENWIAGGGGGSFNRGMTIEFDSPDKPDNPAIWSGLYVPMILDRDPDTNEWMIIATFYHCDSWYDIGRPALPYTAYRYREGKWLQQSMEPKWIGRKANVLVTDLASKKAIDSRKPVLTVSRKEQEVEDRPSADVSYKRIVNKSSGC